MVLINARGVDCAERRSVKVLVFRCFSEMGEEMHLGKVLIYLTSAL